MSITSTAPSMASGGLPTASSAVSPTSEDSNMSNENSAGDNDTCLQLALEGEKLCKAGNCRDGVAFFEAALQAGTDDFRTLSAIYSQLGNAYFYMGDYVKAMQYHKHDLTLARTMADRLGEAKASGNLGNTLKVMGKFEEAVICCRRHLEICQEHRDRVGEGRALYNLGNVYHAKGKHIGRLGHQDPGEFPEEVKALFEKAVQYYEDNMMLMVEIGDRAAQGRACGNLGNVHYLLGNFSRAIHFHQERLKIAKEFRDKEAEKRAHNNLGNAFIFLGEFDKASYHYIETLPLTRILGNKAEEARSYYSLGNVYAILEKYSIAIQYYLSHLHIAQELGDKNGESLAYRALEFSYTSLGKKEEGNFYKEKLSEISQYVELSRHKLPYLNESQETCYSRSETPSIQAKMLKQNRQMLHIDASSGKHAANDLHNRRKIPSFNISDKEQASKEFSLSHANQETSLQSTEINKKISSHGETELFDIISKYQSTRLDDQRCSPTVLKCQPSNLSYKNRIKKPTFHRIGLRSKIGLLKSVSAAKKPNRQSVVQDNVDHFDRRTSVSQQRQPLPDLIAGVQSHRMNEQRAAVPFLPGLTRSSKQPPEILQRLSLATNNEEHFPDESFFEMLMKCQGSRIEEQRSSLPNGGDLYDPSLLHARNATGSNGNKSNLGEQQPSVPLPPHAPTVPDEDFFSLIQRLQAGRLEDQRAELPTENPRNGTATLPGQNNAK